MKQEEGPHRTPKLLGLGLPASRTVSDKCLLFTSPRLWDFVTAAGTTWAAGGRTDVLELGTRGPVTQGPEWGARGITLAPVQTGSAQGCKFPLPPRAGDRDRFRLSWRREWGEVREWGSLAGEQPGTVGSREPPCSLGPTPVPVLS